MSWLLIAIRNILRQSTRAISTVLIIAVGLAALLVCMGFMLSSYDSLQEIAKRTEGHVVILNNTPAPIGGSHQQLTLTHWQAITEELWNDDRVLYVLPRARFEGLISHQEKSAAFFGTGVDAKDEFRVHGPFLRTEGTLDPWLSIEDTPDVVLGRQLAKNLDAKKGDLLTLHTLDQQGKQQHIDVRSAGNYHTGTPEIDDHTLMVNLNTVATLFNNKNISLLAIYLNQPADAHAVKHDLQKKLNNITVQTWHQRAELYDKVKAQYDRIFTVMGLIILLVVFLAIANTIALAIYQRRHEIATFSALGTRPMRIYSNFILEALLLALFATSLGMLLAYLSANAINLANLMMPAPPGRSEGYPIFIYVSWPHYLVTSLVLTGITLIASLVATYRAAKTNIAEALS